MTPLCGRALLGGSMPSRSKTAVQQQAEAKCGSYRTSTCASEICFVDDRDKSKDGRADTNDTQCDRCQANEGGCGRSVTMIGIVHFYLQVVFAQRLVCRSPPPTKEKALNYHIIVANRTELECQSGDAGEAGTMPTDFVSGAKQD